MSPGEKDVGGGTCPRNRSIIPAMSTVPVTSTGSWSGNARGSSRLWCSRSDVVTTVCTAVRPTTSAATSR